MEKYTVYLYNPKVVNETWYEVMDLEELNALKYLIEHELTNVRIAKVESFS
jgi:hypothetical protein